MIEIVVKRDQGYRPGPDISDALLTTEPAALARGTGEINAADPVRRKMLTITGPWLPFYRPGRMARVSLGARVLAGMVIDYSRNIKIEGQTFTVDTTMTLETLDDDQ